MSFNDEDKKILTFLCALISLKKLSPLLRRNHNNLLYTSRAAALKNNTLTIINISKLLLMIFLRFYLFLHLEKVSTEAVNYGRACTSFFIGWKFCKLLDNDGE